MYRFRERRSRRIGVVIKLHDGSIVGGLSIVFAVLWEGEKMKSLMRMTRGTVIRFSAGRSYKTENRQTTDNVCTPTRTGEHWSSVLLSPALCGRRTRLRNRKPGRRRRRRHRAPNEIISRHHRVFRSRPQCPTSWIIQALSPGGIRWTGKISDTRTMALTRSDCGVSEAGEPGRHLTPISPRLSARCIEFADRKLYFTRVSFLRVRRINRAGRTRNFSFPAERRQYAPSPHHHHHP